ncbi:hypothetical protein ACFWZK_19425 [[Kitasatospora] papulosa]|uniref:hypothetical protein n=1 Tax=Streptomyces TaxID=1883 RepID=UPI003442CEE1
MKEIDHIVTTCGMGEQFSGGRTISALKRARRRIGPLEDSATPDYFQSTAAGIAISVASKENTTAEDLDHKMRSNIANFWDSCDDIMHAANGYASPEFAGIKTTLRGVEDMWQAEDERLLWASPRDSKEVFAGRLCLIREKYPKRQRIAQIVADCAGWSTSG